MKDESAKNSVTKFVIIGVPRSGTNMLCTLLNSHPEILCHHELYNPNGIMYATHLRNSDFSLGSIDDRNNDPGKFLNRVWSNELGHKVVGFKFTNRDDEEIYWQVVKDPTVLKIILKRYNRVKTFVSTLVSETTGQWEVYDTSKIAQNKPKVFVDPLKLYSAMNRYSEYYKRVELELKQTGQNAFEVMYEELFHNKVQIDLLQYLGVRQTGAELKVESVKQNPPDLRKIISNYDELEKELKSSALYNELISKSL